MSLATTTGFHLGLLATAFGFGFRHGIDWDHLAALTDITSTQDAPCRSLSLATLYAVGHGLAVFALGLGAVLLSSELPHSVDAVIARVVGATLVAFGIYVFAAFVVGLLASNTATALLGTYGFLQATKRWPLYAAISVATAAASVTIGALFLLGWDAALPSLVGG